MGDTFGEKIRFCEPSWYQGRPSPYYKDTHRRFRQVCRDFVEKELIPNVDNWDRNGYPYKELHKKAYKAGLLGAIYPVEFGGTPPEDFDAFHELIMYDELGRIGCGGVMGQMSINSMALPPILYHGSSHLKNMICRDVITGEKNICLAISEPSAGSDVANIKCTAQKDPTGQFYIINGNKKWITGGMWGDYFTMACRTGGKGMKGLSLIVVPRNTAGFKIRKMETQASDGHNTTFLTLEDVKVPVANLIGEEGKGFKYIVHNFNHERFIIACSANRYARVCYEESIKHALLRKTFGKRLIEHQVIRFKLAEMIRQIESTHDTLERVAYAYRQGVPDSEMGGTCAMLKVQSTMTFELCAREASQIFGGSAIVKEGKGMIIERLYREVRSLAIPGGSEEILRELAVKEAIKTALKSSL